MPAVPSVYGRGGGFPVLPASLRSQAFRYHGRTPRMPIPPRPQADIRRVDKARLHTESSIMASPSAGTTIAPPSRPQAAPGAPAPAQPRRLPLKVFEELEIVRDPAKNLFHQTIEHGAHRRPDLVGLKHHQQIILAQPKNEIMVHFPVLMDDGHHQLFKGYRVQHNNALGPYKGGIRYHPHISA